uniref:Bric-a-brac n=1 Tax=Riptortus pedestris TaxID=329032 RepID=R4WDT9_RIPPE|nr:bric-a-brac [Riptortus pedestris]
MPSPADFYCVKWNDYNTHLGRFFSQLLTSEQFTDVTLWAENKKFKCHKVALSAGSPYFQEVLSSLNMEHPVIVLVGVQAEDIKLILDFLYHGEIRNVDSKRFSSLLNTAGKLKIHGLTEVTIVQSSGKLFQGNSQSGKADSDLTNEIHAPSVEVNVAERSSSNSSEKENTGKKNRTRATYNEGGNLERALQQMEWGMSLPEAAKLYNIPRSTLYVKAKLHSGLNMASRKDHKAQDLNPALQAIADGMSLKRASDEFKIPKTVLWRRVQKRLDILNKVKCRRNNTGKQLDSDVSAESNGGVMKRDNVSFEMLENAVLKLFEVSDHKTERGSERNVQDGDCTKVPESNNEIIESNYMQVRSDPVKIENDGNFQDVSTVIQKSPVGEQHSSNENLIEVSEEVTYRNSDNVQSEIITEVVDCEEEKKLEEMSLKNTRLSEAVEACKTGKMSQALASSTFLVPKTTIWRRLKKNTRQEEKQQKQKLLLGKLMQKQKVFIEKEDHRYTLTDKFQRIPKRRLTTVSKPVLPSQVQYHTNQEHPLTPPSSNDEEMTDVCDVVTVVVGSDVPS